MKSAANSSIPDREYPSGISTAYNRSGERYRVYADGDADNPFLFNGPYAFGDRETWAVLERQLHQLRLGGRHDLRILDLGCGPGTWLRRVIGRARQMGFTDIVARGVDLAESQVRRARILSHTLASHDDIHLRFEVGDIRTALSEENGIVDLCLCLYGVLNHLPAPELPAILGEIAHVTSGYFIATVRAVGSTPTIYVDGINAARRFHQDNVLDKLVVEFQDGSHAAFSSHLFSAAEIKSLVSPAMAIEDLRGLDLFHGRFANDARWNPSDGVPTTGFLHELRLLEDRYGQDPAFIDHATHLLLVAKSISIRSDNV